MGLNVDVVLIGTGNVILTSVLVRFSPTDADSA